jgi:hypothetical protein
VTLLCLRIEDAYNLFGRLSRAEYNFRQSLSNMPVMVDLGKAQVLERQMPQALYGLVNADSAVFDLV